MCGCRCRRCVRTAGPTCSPARTSRVTRSSSFLQPIAGSGGLNDDVALHRGSHPAELIELAERDTDAELVDALHDASGTPWARDARVGEFIAHGRSIARRSRRARGLGRGVSRVHVPDGTWPCSGHAALPCIFPHESCRYPRLERRRQAGRCDIGHDRSIRLTAIPPATRRRPADRGRAEQTAEGQRLRYENLIDHSGRVAAVCLIFPRDRRKGMRPCQPAELSNVQRPSLPSPRLGEEPLRETGSSS